MLILFLILAICSSPLKTLAHPGGNMVVANGLVTFTYVFPPSQSSHYSSVFIWDRIHGTRKLISSEFNSSDFTFYAKGDTVYYVESRDEQNASYFRILKGRAGDIPTEIWPWQNDSLEVGYYGFMMNNDETITFAKYPNMYEMGKSGEVKKIETGLKYIGFFKEVDDGYLLKSEDEVVLVDTTWKVSKRWENLVNPRQENLPFMGNIIFHVDYQNESLLVAYWGGRQFYLLEEDGTKQILLQLKSNQVAHWVAMENGSYFLFGSSMEPGEPITPAFYVFENDAIKIWEE